MLFCILFCAYSVFPEYAKCQSTSDIIVQNEYEGESLQDVITSWQSNLDIQFVYKTEWIDGITVQHSTIGRSIHSILIDAIGSRGLTISFRRNFIILYQRDNIKFSSFADYAAKKYGVDFIYMEDWIADFQISGSFIGKEYSMALKQMFSNTTLKVVYRGNSVIIYRQPNANNEVVNVDGLVSKDVVIVGKAENNTKNKCILSGKVRDGKTGQELYGARVYVKQTRTGVISNSYGFYTMELTPGYYEVNYNFIGFETQTVKVLLNGSGELNIELFEESLLLNEVTVEERSAYENLSTMNTGMIELDIKSITQIPSFLGETDVLKSFLTLPGVNTVGEGAPGFNVRGGTTDQNLYLFDGAPVFNPSHLFGFFSNYNADVVNQATLYKGSIPAQFGGRSSSVLDVNSQNEVIDDFGFKGGIGLVYSRLTAEVPLISDISSIIIGGRKSYADWMLQRAQDLEVKQSEASFDDFNIKINNKIGQNDKIAFSYYNSNDAFKFAQDTSYHWSTKNYVLRWRHLFGKRWFGEFITYQANYSYSIQGLKPNYEFKMNSGIRLNGVNAQFIFVPNDWHNLSIGGSVLSYQFNPGELNVDDPNSILAEKKLDQEKSRELSLFVQDEIPFALQWTISAGLRYSNFATLGSKNITEYTAGLPRNKTNISGSRSFDHGDIIKSYQAFEPRISVKYSINNQSSLKTAYNRLQQYIHTISNTAAVTPVDIWKPSDFYLKPQSTDQFSLGYFRNSKNNHIESSIEIYYKNLHNLIDYKNGAELLLNENLEQDILNGKGRAYGLELYIRKNKGRLTGWLSYTLARTERLFTSRFKEETINNGKYFPANYDRPNTLSFSANHQVNKRWRIGFNFLYSTGRPITLPQARYEVDGITFAAFSDRNQYRIADYHRLDLSVTLEPGHKRKKIWDGSWTLALYNVYARKNAYSVFFRNERGRPPGAFQLSVLGTIFPSLTYNLKFKNSKINPKIKSHNLN